MINAVSKKTLYYFFLRVFVYVSVFSESQLDAMPGVSTLLFLLRNGLVVVFFLLAMVQDDGIKQKAAVLGGSVVLFFAYRLLANDSGLTPITLFLVIWNARDKDLQKIFRFVFTDIIVGYLVVYGLCILGIAEDVVSDRTVGSGSVLSGSYTRHSLGFLLHNQSPTTFLLVVLLMIGYRGEHLSFWDSGVILALNFLFFYLCGSRVVFLLGIAAVALYWVVRLLKKRFTLKYLIKLGYLAFPACCAGIMLATWLYDAGNPLLNKLNDILNSRLRFGNTALHSYGFTLLGEGQAAGTYLTMDVTVDSGYVVTYIQHGLVVLLIMLTLFEISMHRAIRRNNVYLVLALVLLAAENIINAHIFSYKLIPFYCIALCGEAPPLTGGVPAVSRLRLE